MSLQILARNRFLCRFHLALAAQVVDQHAPLSIDTAQSLVILAFDAVLTDDVALMVLDELRRVELRFADLANVTHHVRGESILRILPPPGPDQLHLRKGTGVLMRFDPGHLVARQLIFDDDLRPRAAAPDHSG